MSTLSPWLFLGLCCLVGFSSGLRVPWWHIKIAQEQGPNACVVEEIPNSNHKFWTECRYWMNREICGQKTIIRYDCCEGFQQVPNQEGCTGVKPLKNIVDTAADLGATNFVSYITAAGIKDELMREGAFTLFAPTNDAFQNMQREMKARLESYRGNPQNPILLYHMMNKKITSKQFRPNLMVETRYNGHKVRINKYSNGIVTVNCGSIVRKDQEATNGIVHLLDSVLDPTIVLNRDVGDMVMQDGRFAIMAKAMEQSAFMNRLRSGGSDHFTVLAPSDEAFNKIPKTRREKILQDKNAREALLENHVIPHTLCLPAIIGEHRLRALGGSKLHFDCDFKSKTVDDTRLRGDYILGANGIVHVIDDVLLPDRAKSLLQLAENENLFTFLELVKVGGLEEAFESFGEYTIFAPSEEALYSIPVEVLDEAREDPEKARMLILYHCMQGRITTNSITDNQIMMSLDEENPVRLLVYRKAVGIEDAIVKKSDLEGQNGVLHIINKVIFPSNHSAGDILSRDGNFMIFLRAMEKVLAYDPTVLNLNEPGNSYTFLTPTDEAFENLGQAKLNAVLDDAEYLSKVIKNHVVDRMLCSEAFMSGLFYDIQTKLDIVDVVRKDDTMKVNDATVITSDITNINGVIHVIDKVLLPKDESSYSHSGRELIIN